MTTERDTASRAAREQRGESELEMLDRNWGELLQELRVVQSCSPRPRRLR